MIGIQTNVLNDQETNSHLSEGRYRPTTTTEMDKWIPMETHAKAEVKRYH